MRSQSGAIVSMHMVIRGGDAKLSDADKAINEVKNIIRQILPNALVWVHLEPDMKIINTDDIRRIADLVCSKYGGHVGDINVINIEGVNAIHILVYLPQNMNIVEAHNVATEIESEIAKIYSMPHHVTVSVLPDTKAL